MARTKSKNSDRTFWGLNLDGPGTVDGPNEQYLKKFLDRKGISMASFVRSLIRGWRRTGEIGKVDLNQD